MTSVRYFSTGPILLVLAAGACDSSMTDSMVTDTDINAAAVSSNSRIRSNDPTPLDTSTIDNIALSANADIHSSATAFQESNNSDEATSHSSFSRSSEEYEFSGFTVSATATATASSSSFSNSSADTSTSSALDLTGNTSQILSEEYDERCVQVGEILEVGVTGMVYDLYSGFTISNLTAYSNIDQWQNPNVQLLSHSDEAISLTINRQDIIDFNVQYEDEIEQVFISAINNGASKPVLLKKRFHYDACAFALYTDSGCSVITPNSNQMTTEVNGVSITTQGCNILKNPAIVPMLELK